MIPGRRKSDLITQQTNKIKRDGAGSRQNQGATRRDGTNMTRKEPISTRKKSPPITNAG